MKKALILLSILWTTITAGYACTAAVVTGKATKDGRPLIWKVRDTDNLQNAMKFFRGQRYNFIGVVDCEPRVKEELWLGTNSAGLSIINTQSFNLEKTVNGIEPGAKNGEFMYKVLSLCATVEELKQMLDSKKLKLDGLCANFGIIDAKGGAGWFEISTKSYKYFDANDSKVAPNGYIVRTNFSFTGKEHEGLGYVRYQTTEEELYKAAKMKSITPIWMFQNLDRSFRNPKLGLDLHDGKHNLPNTTGWFIDQDLISRVGTSCSGVIHGVKTGENPELTTMWTVIGYPPVSTAFPFWVKGADKLIPEIYKAEKGEKVTIFGKKVDTLKERVYAFHEGIGSDRYFRWEELYNRQGNGIIQKLEPIENEIEKRTTIVTKKWYKKGKINSKELRNLYNSLSGYVETSYKNLFNL